MDAGRHRGLIAEMAGGCDVGERGSVPSSSRRSPPWLARWLSEDANWTMDDGRARSAPSVFGAWVPLAAAIEASARCPSSASTAAPINRDPRLAFGVPYRPSPYTTPVRRTSADIGAAAVLNLKSRCKRLAVGRALLATIAAS
ncbi:uncharacterized protein PSFLO_01191 [Pseudozyma flocculosa]|uniref:Uncharacterized protein n=1 Tax=Pseudozyma flocculosa TaxID=84751 RepID=A0A5C3EV50_9BASI|nr:uncharacterized protein PSFLO_01191 [Pseudozyma flocculosa]